MHTGEATASPVLFGVWKFFLRHRICERMPAGLLEGEPGWRETVGTQHS